MRKDILQKYEINLYKKNNRFYSYILDNNHDNKFLIKKLYWNNKDILIRNCYYYLEKKAIENQKRYWLLYHDYIARTIENF